jgi:hypothetical protein
MASFDARWERNGALLVFEHRARVGVGVNEVTQMQAVYELAPVIAEIISGHCAGTRARADFVHACLHGDWQEAKVMVEGMLAEPWHLIGHQERRLREFLDLLQLSDGTLMSQLAANAETP